MLCERLQGPFVPSGVVTSSGPAKSSQDDAQRTRRPVQLPACSSPVRRAALCPFCVTSSAWIAASACPVARGSPVVRRAGSPVFVLCSKSARGNLCSDGGKVEGFRPRVYAPLFSSVRLLFNARAVACPVLLFLSVRPCKAFLWFPAKSNGPKARTCQERPQKQRRRLSGSFGTKEGLSCLFPVLLPASVSFCSIRGKW